VIRQAVTETDPGIAAAQVARFDEYLQGPLAQPRLNAILLVWFAGTALVIAAVGLFGTMATMVRQRTLELGIRMAVGATARQVAQLVLGRALAITAAGSFFGLLGATFSTRLLSSLLYQVSPTDGATLLVVTALLIAVALLAATIPARSSTRIDPIVALRSE
jgi:ABC-type antimicrobial peptide transport system permease subunit